ncbi:MAG: anti-sigma factor family protein [Gammaproteobacteria bacterium]
MTIDPKYFELIQAEIDGEIDAAGKAELEHFLAESEEGRAVYEELETLCRSLDSMPETDPPAHLRHVLLNQAPIKAPPRPSPNPLQRLFSGPLLGYVGVFAAGVALTLALLDSGQISRGAFDDVTGLVGTIADSGRIAPAHGTISIDESEVAGTVTLRSTGPILIVDFDLSARQPVEIVAGYSDKTIWFNGFAQLESTGTSIAAETGAVTVRMDGKRRYAVYLNNPGMRPATIDLRFMANDEVIHEAQLSFSQVE